MNETIAKQVRENTGSSMCDSGGAYGYTYNKPLPTERLTFDDYDGQPYISLPHLMEEHLDPEEDYTKEMHKFWDLIDPGSHTGELGLMRVWAAYNTRLSKSYRDNHPFDKRNIKKYFGDILEEKDEYDKEDYIEDALHTLRGEEHNMYWGNIYNDENDMDQVFEYCTFTHWNGSDYILISTHNGCDVRGGYSTPVVYEGDFETFLCSLRWNPYCCNGHLDYWDDRFKYTDDGEFLVQKLYDDVSLEEAKELFVTKLLGEKKEKDSRLPIEGQEDFPFYQELPESNEGNTDRLGMVWSVERKNWYCCACGEVVI